MRPVLWVCAALLLCALAQADVPSAVTPSPASASAPSAASASGGVSRADASVSASASVAAKSASSGSAGATKPAAKERPPTVEELKKHIQQHKDRIQKLIKKKTAAETHIKQLRKRLTKMDTDHSKLKATREAASKVHKNTAGTAGSSRKKLSALQKDVQEARGKYKVAKKARTDMKRKISYTYARLKHLTKHIDRLTQSDPARRTASARDTIPKLKQNRQSLKEKLQKLQKLYQSTKSNEKKAFEGLRKAARALAATHADAQTNEKVSKFAKTQADIAHRNLGTLKQAVAAAKAKLAHFKRVRDEAGKELKQHQEKVKKLNKQLAKLTAAATAAAKASSAKKDGKQK